MTNVNIKELIEKSMQFISFTNNETVCDFSSQILKDNALGMEHIYKINWQRNLFDKQNPFVNTERCLASLSKKGYVFIDLSQDMNICNYKNEKLKVSDLIRNSNVETAILSEDQFIKDFYSFKLCNNFSLNKQLFNAAYNRNLAGVKKAIEAGADVDYFDEAGGTSLYVASQFGFEEIVSYLLSIEKKPNLETKSVFGMSPLYAVTSNGHYNIAKELLKAGASIETTYDIGYTPLFVAANAGNLAMVKLLIENNANKNKLIGGKKPQDFAKAQGYDEIHKYLLDGEISSAKQAELDNLLFLSTFKNDIAGVTTAIVNGANVNVVSKIYKATPLFAASQFGYKAIAQILLSQKDINTEIDFLGTTPLMVAVTNKKYDIVKMLLEAKANINAINPNHATSIYIAVEKNDIEMVKILLEFKPNIDVFVEKYPLIHLALNRGYTEIVEQLLNHNCNIDIKYKGFNLLYSASKHGYTDIVNLILEKSKININEVQDNGKTALGIAAENGDIKTVKALLQKGANIGYAQKQIFKLLFEEYKELISKEFTPEKTIEKIDGWVAELSNFSNCIKDNLNIDLCGMDKLFAEGV